MRVHSGGCLRDTSWEQQLQLPFPWWRNGGQEQRAPAEHVMPHGFPQAGRWAFSLFPGAEFCLLHPRVCSSQRNSRGDFSKALPASGWATEVAQAEGFSPFVSQDFCFSSSTWNKGTPKGCAIAREEHYPNLLHCSACISELVRGLGELSYCL